MFILVDDPAPAIDRQPLGGDRRARDVAAQAFQAAALVRLADRGGVERKARQLGQQHVVGRSLSWRHAVQGQGLTAGVRSDGDAILDGRGLSPATLGLGAGSDSNGPLAVAVIGGPVSSTLLTLVVTLRLFAVVAPDQQIS